MLLTPKEAAALLKVSPRTLLGWAKDGEIKVVRLSAKVIRFRLSDLPISDAEREAIVAHATGKLTAPATDAVLA